MLKLPTAVTPSWQPMHSSEFPYSVFGLLTPPESLVKPVPVPFVSAWFHSGPYVGFEALCGTWQDTQISPVPSRVERSWRLPAICCAQAGAEIMTVARTAITIAIFFIIRSLV